MRACISAPLRSGMNACMADVHGSSDPEYPATLRRALKRRLQEKMRQEGGSVEEQGSAAGDAGTST